jgi:hypothetical protein
MPWKTVARLKARFFWVVPFWESVSNLTKAQRNMVTREKESKVSWNFLPVPASIVQCGHKAELRPAVGARGFITGFQKILEAAKEKRDQAVTFVFSVLLI